MNDTLLGIVLGISTLVAIGGIVSLSAALTSRPGGRNSRH